MKQFGLFISLCLCALPVAAQRGGVGKPIAPKPACCVTNALHVVAPSDKSLWQLDSTWVNDSGEKVQLSSLSGRVQVVVMFFASCEYACPLLVHEARQIEAALPETVRQNTGFTLISFDSDRDTPAVLRAYRERQNLGTNRWTLLQGKPDDTLEIAALLGVKYKKDARGQFAHSNLITVLDQQGEIIYQQIGLNQKVELTVQAIERAFNQKPSTLR